MSVPRASRSGAPERVLRRALLLAVLGAPGCGNLTAGGATGEATVYVTGESTEVPAASPAALVGHAGTVDPASSPGGGSGLASPGSRPTDDSDDDPEGELELRFGLALVTDGGTVVPLTEDEVRVQVEFPGSQEVRAVTRTVPTGRYSSLRVVFTEIEAEVDAGLVVNGVEITGPVEVELEADSLVVERPLSLALEEDEAAELLVDMNASAWLQAVDPDLRVVAGAVVSSALRVVRR